jgi:hypothetical protein
MEKDSALEAMNEVCVETGLCPEKSALEIVRPLLDDEQMRKLEDAYNTAVSGAQNCQLKGTKGIIDGYLAVSEAVPEQMTPKAQEVFAEFWDVLDDEILNALAKHCGAELH